MAPDIRLQPRCITNKPNYIPLHEAYSTPRGGMILRLTKKGRPTSLYIGQVVGVDCPGSPVHNRKAVVHQILRNSPNVVVLFHGETFVFEEGQLEPDTE